MTEEPLKGEPLAILLVEDDPDHAELVMRCFEEHQVANRLFHVRDGESALDFLHHRGAYTYPATSPRPHLVLLDLRLPGIGGLDVLAEIKTSPTLKTMPVVVLTTSSARPDIESAYDQHVNSYVVKPLDFDKFRLLMKELGFYWLMWNHYPWSD